MPTLLSCGSNGSYHLAQGHNRDTSSLTPTLELLRALPEGAINAEVLDLVSSSAHTLVIVQYELASGIEVDEEERNRDHLAGDDLHSRAGDVFIPGDAVAGSGDGVGNGKSPNKRKRIRTVNEARKKYRALCGIGTNSYGQLGRPCALRDEEDVQVIKDWRRLDFVGEAASSSSSACATSTHRQLAPGRDQDGEDGGWEVRKIAATWTGSLVVYRRTVANTEGGTSSAISDIPFPSDAQSGVTATSGHGIDEEMGFEETIISCGSNDFNELGLSLAELEDKAGTKGLMDGHSPITGTNPPRIVDVGLERGEWVEHIQGGQRHVVVVLSKGVGRGRTQRVMGWGAGRRGELDPSTLGGLQGSDDAETNAGNGRVDGKRKGKGKGKAPMSNRATAQPPTRLALPLGPDEQIVHIALGSSHSLVLTSRRRVLGWGSDTKSQVQGTSDLTDIVAIGATWGGSYFVDATGQVWSQGSNVYGQLCWEDVSGSDQGGDGLARVSQSIDGAARYRRLVGIPDGKRVGKLVTGSEHMMLLLYDNSVNGKHDDDEDDARRASQGQVGLWTGGWNEHGNLALGDEENRAALVEVDVSSTDDSVGSTGGSIRGIWGGCASTWAWVE